MFEFKRNCPDCGVEIIHKSENKIYAKNAWYHARKHKKLCISCCQKNKHPTEIGRMNMSKSQLGRKHSEATKLKQSNTAKQRYEDPNNRKEMSIIMKKVLHKPDVRKKHIQSMLKWCGRSIDKGCLELIENLNRAGLKLIPNYIVTDNDFLGYLDGYDPVHSIAFEFDTKYHFKNKQKEKDLIRQNKIIDILKPKKFLRYNAVNKTWKNVLC